MNKKAEADEETGLTESRQTDCLQTGQTVHIEDITSSEVQIIDNFEKLFKVVEEMKSIKGSTTEDNNLESLMKPLFLSWHTFDQTKKALQYSKYSCHELNFFLYRRDKPFFDSVVKNFIHNKMEKTFVDWYLLGIE